MTHELCHIFGIKHCYYFQCSLNESSSISEAAGQPLFVCPICLKKLRKSLQFNTLERYKGLLEATKQMQKAACDALQVCTSFEQTLSCGVVHGDTVLTNHVGASDCEQISGASPRMNYVPSKQDTTNPSNEHKGKVASSGKSRSKSVQDVPKSTVSSGDKHSQSKQSQSTNGGLKIGEHSVKRTSDLELPKELRHSEQLEYFSKAIKWLEKVIKNLERFESQWEKSSSK